jgi:hypothetical protein
MVSISIDYPIKGKRKASLPKSFDGPIVVMLFCVKALGTFQCSGLFCVRKNIQICNMCKCITKISPQFELRAQVEEATSRSWCSSHVTKPFKTDILWQSVMSSLQMGLSGFSVHGSKRRTEPLSILRMRNFSAS